MSKQTAEQLKTDLPGLFSFITEGVYVVCVKTATDTNAFVAAWLMQTSFDPPLLALSVNSEHMSYKMLMEDKKCTISVIPSGRLDIVKHFAQSKAEGVDKLDGTHCTHKADNGCALLDDALAFYECDLENTMETGDHTICLLRVRRGAYKAGSEERQMNYSECKGIDGSEKLLPSTL